MKKNRRSIKFLKKRKNPENSNRVLWQKFECNIPPRIFLVNKPRGIHSGDVLKHFKYHLPRGFGKIGHLGTLDPFAEGLLLVAVGQPLGLAFSFEELLTKSYYAKGIFHWKSSTGDSDGELSSSTNKGLPSFDKILEVCNSILGEYWQSPPHFSAAKHEGKALYKYAREGVLIDKPPVRRVIHDINDFELMNNGAECCFEVEVSSGTYIRTLFEDLCKKLGTVGYLEGLIRTKIGDVELAAALKKKNWL